VSQLMWEWSLCCPIRRSGVLPSRRKTGRRDTPTRSPGKLTSVSETSSECDRLKKCQKCSLRQPEAGSVVPPSPEDLEPSDAVLQLLSRMERDTPQISKNSPLRRRDPTEISAIPKLPTDICEDAVISSARPQHFAFPWVELLLTAFARSAGDISLQ